jgi:3-oxoacyl-[acyl-carrier protein] reductase
VAFTYVSKPDAAGAIVRELEGEGRSAIALRADSADAAALERAVDDAASKLGGLDVLINNAGVMVFGNVADLAVEEFDRHPTVRRRGAGRSVSAWLRGCGAPGRRAACGRGERRAWRRSAMTRRRDTRPGSRRGHPWRAPGAARSARRRSR